MTLLPETLMAYEPQFFALTSALTQNVGADFAFVAVPTADNTRAVRTCGLTEQSEPRENFVYALANTPCFDAMDGGTCIYPDDIQNLFPQDHLLREMRVVGYVGTPIVNALGARLGIVVVLYRTPIKLSEIHLRRALDATAHQACRLLEQCIQRQNDNDAALHLQTLFAHTPIGVLLCNSDDFILSANPAIAHMLGYTTEELLDKSIRFLCQSNDDPSAIKQLLESHQTNVVVEKSYIHKNGSLIAVRVTASISTPSERPQILRMVEDISQRKRTEMLLHAHEHALRNSEMRYRLLFENAVEALVVFDVSNGCFVDCNRNALALFGANQLSDLSTLTPADLSPTLQPDGSSSLEKSLAWIQRAVEGEAVVFEWAHRSLQGKDVLCEVRLLRVPDPVRILIRGSMIDVQERKNIEREREQLIRQLELRNTELERFTYTVSHDLKSPLITIKGFLGLLIDDIQQNQNSSVQEDIREISRAADHMYELLNNLLQLSRAGRLTNSKQTVSIADTTRQVVALLHGFIQQKNIFIEIQDDMPLVLGDRIRLQELLQNLVHNACKFTNDSKTPKVVVGYDPSRSTKMRHTFFVADNGIGIPKIYQEKIFGLFEKLDIRAEGTGIGLAIVRRIIEGHGGRVWVESAGEGHGATFFFSLPSLEAAEDAP